MSNGPGSRRSVLPTMTGLSWFLDDAPSNRFPVYCRGNVGEIVPNVPTPLSATITTAAFRRGFRELFADTGAFHDAELAEPSATGGIFGGYLYFNLSFARAFARRMPGLRVADIDRQMFGSSGMAPPYRPGPGDRNLLTALRAAVRLGASTVRHTPLDLEGHRADTERWLRSLPAEPSADEVAELASRYTDRFSRDLRSLLEASLGAGIPMSLLERVGSRAERAEPGLLVKALSGLGTIETARPAVAMWKLGRIVSASPALTAAFDAGARGLHTRLRTIRGTDVDTFLEHFGAFLAEHGHRGPNEVELAVNTWSTAPDIALAAIERLRLVPGDADPETAMRRLTAERITARERFRRGVSRPLRPLVGRLLDRAAAGAARREQAKGTLVLDLSGLRTALFRLADSLVAHGDLPSRIDLFMVTVDELPDLVREPAAFSGVIAQRRARYQELNALVPPFSFVGRIPDPSTWARRGDRPRFDSPLDETLTGIGVASGVARGAARIVTDPSDPRGIVPGEVLVAPITDPAWTPLFLAASAVVVDVGALQSHAAIVARELGIPAVVSVTGATARIADGDELEVDGDRGTVRVVSRRTSGRRQTGRPSTRRLD